MSKKRDVIAEFDGGGGSNGAKKVYGVHIIDAKSKEQLHVAYGLLPNAQTYNQAEWTAAKMALSICYLFKDDISSVIIRGDSQLVVYQLLGKYKCKTPHLIPYWGESKKIEEKLLHSGVAVDYEWVRRESNETADALGRLI
jgi:ribonuclease HI